MGVHELVIPLAALAIIILASAAALHEKRRVRRHRAGMTVNGDMVGGNYTVGNITINSRTFSGSNISMKDGKIIVDGVDVTASTGVDMKSILEVKITGDVGNVYCEKGLTIIGNVRENVDAQGGVNCNDVGGDVRAAGGVNCDDVKGNVHAGGGVSCDDVGGNVQAGGSVSRG